MWLAAKGSKFLAYISASFWHTGPWLTRWMNCRRCSLNSSELFWLCSFLLLILAHLIKRFKCTVTEVQDAKIVILPSILPILNINSVLLMIKTISNPSTWNFTPFHQVLYLALNYVWQFSQIGNTRQCIFMFCGQIYYIDYQIKNAGQWINS